MDRPLSILVLGLLSVSQLWEGVQCDGYSHDAPPIVEVQKGLCVVIPCNFTYRKSDMSSTAPLHGYWYEDGSKTQRDPAVATNDESKEVAPGARGRFRLSEKLEEGDCSLFITDAQQSDQKDYFFRMEKGQGYSYFSRTQVRVTETPTPKIEIPGKLQAGKPVNLTCRAARCPWKSPQISWEFTRNISGILSSLPNDTKMASFESNFVLSAADNGQILTCRVTYGSDSTRPVTSAETIHLNVGYPPRRPRISGNLTHPNGSPQSFRDVLQIEAQEGDSLQLSCEADGNPLPHVTWVERSQSGTQHSISGHQLRLYNVKRQDMGGYTCRAENTEGSSETTFQVYMAYSPEICSHANSSCWREDDGYGCNCSVCSYPGPELQWVVDGKTVEGNASNEEVEVTSWYKADEATSTLRLKGAWDGHRSVLCRGNSSSGETSVHFLLYSFKRDTLKQNLTSGVVGAVIVLVLVAIILLIVLVHKKCRQGSKSITDPESCSDRSTLVLGRNPSDVQGFDVTTPPNHAEAKGISKEPQKPEKSPDESYEDSQNLHYATVQFSGLRPVPEVTSDVATTEYAEIKTS